MGILYQAIIHTNPVTKKNSQQIIAVNGRSIPIPSKQYRNYSYECFLLLPKKRNPISVPVNVKCVFYMGTHRAVDQTNLQEAIDDILVSCHILQDDNRNIIAAHDGSRVYYDKDDPRTEITITELEEDYEVWNGKQQNQTVHD